MSDLNTKPNPAPEAAVRTRTRSPNYPSMPLPDALAAIEKLWNAQHKHPAHLDSVLTLLGFSTLTGPAGRAVGALAQYGLTKETGSGDNRTIALSELALDYVLADNEDAKSKAARIAALKPPVYANLWEKYGRFLPNDDTIQKYLVRERNFNPGVVSEVVSDFRATFDFAKLGASVDEAIKTPPNDSPTPKSETTKLPIDPVKHDARQQAAPQPADQKRTVPPMTAGLRYLPIPLDIGDAPIPVGMSEDDFDLLLDTLKLWKKKLVQSATVAPAPLARSFPAKATWKNQDFDKEVTILGEVGRDDSGEIFYASEDGTGLKGSELTFH